MLEIDATNLPRLMACNGSRLMVGTLPAVIGDQTSRDEGNAAHYMAMMAFYGKMTIEEMVDRKAPNGVYMTPEMMEYVSDYLSAIDRSPRLSGEMEIDTSYNEPTWRVLGRADHIAHDTDTLFVDDLKYGWRIVEPENNWTLISHAVGWCIRNAKAPATIVLTIHQPRPYHPDGSVRSVTMTYTELLEKFERIAETMRNPTDILNTGPHCGNCPALATCTAARKAEMNAIDASELAFSENVDNATLAFELDTLKRAAMMIKSRLDALEELAKHRIKAGKIIENYSVETALSNTQWKDFVTPGLLLMLSQRDVSVAKLPTPKQAIRAGIPETIIAPLTERVPTGLKLVRVNANKKAARLFKPATERK